MVQVSSPSRENMVQVKLWRVCEPEQEQPGGAEVTLCPGEGRLELVAFHPTSSGLLAVGSTKTAQLWDTSRQQSPLAALEPHGDQLQSLSWKQDGSLLASSCKDKKLRVFDPRAQLTPVQVSPSTGLHISPNPQELTRSIIHCHPSSECMLLDRAHSMNG
eukprot:XP_014039697.1 PREDICTED: coronin-7-like [Salmo salar]